jgi:hypothetical protein
MVTTLALLPMAERRGRAYARVVILPAAPDLGLLLVRTGYSDDRAWHAATTSCDTVGGSDNARRCGRLEGS